MMSTRSEAAELFAQMVFEKGYQEGIHSAAVGIAEPFGMDKEKWHRAGEMVSRLDNEGRKCLQFLLHDAVQTALFHVLVDLDGAAGYHKINGKTAEFTLGLRVYEDAPFATEPASVIEEITIAPTTKGEDLHDIFLGLGDEAQEKGSKTNNVHS